MARAFPPPAAALPPSPAEAEAKAAAAQEARETIAKIEKFLAAPPYLTRRELRIQGLERTDKDLRASRRNTMEARDGLMSSLRVLAADSQRHARVRETLGAAECRRIEQAIERLFDGGPGSEEVETAVRLWRAPRPF